MGGDAPLPPVLRVLKVPVRSTRSVRVVPRRSFNLNRVRVAIRRAPSAKRRRSKLTSKHCSSAHSSKKVKLKQGEKEQIVTKAAAGIEQLVNQFAKGDHRARRDLITLADTLGVDLMAGQRKAIEDVLAPNHQATLDAYVARRKDVHASSAPVRVLARPELLDDDSEN